jgi:hypothetical protein
MLRLAGISTWQLSHLQVSSFMALILSQVGRQGQHLLFLFFPLDTERKLDTTDGNKVDTANPLCLDELGHAVILQESVDTHKGGNAFSFFLFKLAFILEHGKMPAAPEARGLQLPCQRH